MDLGIRSKVALVAGASRGLGRAIAEELATEGTDLVLCARDAEALAGVRRSVERATGVRVIAVPADLGGASGVERVTDAALGEFGHVDILVTNTGGPPPGPFESHDADAWRKAVAELLESAIGLCRAVLPGMKERGWGRIVNVTSVAVKRPVHGLILSNSIRAAVTGFARTLANEVAAHGITVNNVMPGYTRTRRLEQLVERAAANRGAAAEDVMAEWAGEIPAGRVGEPREFAAVVAFLASERASFVNGTSIAVDGGWTGTLL